MSESPLPAAIAIESVGMTVSDMDKAVEFYTSLSFQKILDVEVLGGKLEHRQGLFNARMRVVRMRLGNELIELTEYLTPKGRPIPPDSRSNDQWFQHLAIAVRDMDQAYQCLCHHNVQFTSTAPQRLPDWNPAVAGISAFYFNDPDGHNLELIHFPTGKGNPKWQHPTDSLFLGIDHTAIVVFNTEASLQFYRGLGLELVGESKNSGAKQEQLSSVPGAQLRISSLKARAGPGIELLEYLQPQDGRAIPGDKGSNDLIHHQTTLVVPDAAATVQMRHSKSTKPTTFVEIPNNTPGFIRGFLGHDPDGHAVRLIEHYQTPELE